MIAEFITMAETFSSEGRFLRQTRRGGYAARVSLVIETYSPNPQIEFNCTGEGWTAQGNIEEVPAEGYDDWKGGAVAGIRHAMRQAGRTDCSVSVTRILGMATDTNPSIVAAAAAFAVWDAIEYQPSASQVEFLQETALTSWDKPHDLIPVT